MIFKPKIKNYKILGIHPFYIWFNQNRIQIVEKRPYKNPAWNHKNRQKCDHPVNQVTSAISVTTYKIELYYNANK